MARSTSGGRRRTGRVAPLPRRPGRQCELLEGQARIVVTEEVGDEGLGASAGSGGRRRGRAARRRPVHDTAPGRSSPTGRRGPGRLRLGFGFGFGFGSASRSCSTRRTTRTYRRRRDTQDPASVAHAVGHGRERWRPAGVDGQVEEHPEERLVGGRQEQRIAERRQPVALPEQHGALAAVLPRSSPASRTIWSAVRPPPGPAQPGRRGSGDGCRRGRRSAVRGRAPGEPDVGGTTAAPARAAVASSRGREAADVVADHAPAAQAAARTRAFQVSAETGTSNRATSASTAGTTRSSSSVSLTADPARPSRPDVEDVGPSRPGRRPAQGEIRRTWHPGRRTNPGWVEDSHHQQRARS